MTIIAYHVSPIEGLSILRPIQTREDESDRYGLFLTPSLKDAEYWRSRIEKDRGIQCPYTYQVSIPDEVEILTDGNFPGTVRVWDRQSHVWLGQIWIDQAVATIQIGKEI